jgi:hypothetical protein
MRVDLKPLTNQRVRFTATFSELRWRRGRRFGGIQPHVMLTDIEDHSGRHIADHIWIQNQISPFGRGVFSHGDRITFGGLVYPYR